VRFNPQHRDLIFGTLIGDVSLSLAKPNSQAPRYSFTQAHSKAEYVNHVFLVLRAFYGQSPKFKNALPHHRTGRVYKSIRSQTYSHKLFWEFFNLFYERKGTRYVKKVPSNIEYFLNPRSLAYWFMDDGSLDIGGGYRLATQGFSYSDHQQLKSALEQVFGFKVSVFKHSRSRRDGRQLYGLYISAHSGRKFTELVYPYVYPIRCIRYKLHPVSCKGFQPTCK
jgi:hypothetical protein